MNNSGKTHPPASTSNRVLKLLESKKGNFVSGQELASELGISRTAVWKAVRKLKNEGFKIEAVTNRGYCLPSDNDVLSAECIFKYLSEIASCRVMTVAVDEGRADVLGAGGQTLVTLDIKVFDNVDSTNSLCMKMASEGALGGFIAIAGSQSRGRGRRGRAFYSPEGTGLYMSILLRPSGLSSEQAMRLTTIAAVAVAEAIEAVSDKKADIKWVNDIYVDGRKVSGILTEASFDLEDSTLAYAVLGIGINVYEPEGGFPDSIKDIAGSVSSYHNVDDQPGSVTDPVLKNGGRNRIAAEIIARFYEYCIAELYKAFQSTIYHGTRQYLDEYRRRCFVIGREVDVLKAGAPPTRAYVTGIDNECHLHVIYTDGRTETLSSGEISLRV